MFRFDIYSGRVMLLRPVPRATDDPNRTANWTEPRPVSDSDLMRVSVWLEFQGNMPGVNIKRLNAMIGMLAEDGSYNSNRDRLLGFIQPWIRYDAGKAVPVYTGPPALDTYLLKVCGVDLDIEYDSPEETKMQRSRKERYLLAVTRCFFISMVRRIWIPGEKVDTALILESGEGHMKSQFLRVLAFGRDELFSDNIPLPLHGRDAELHLRGKMIVELPEAIAIKRGDPSAVKAFLSTSTRQDRPVWGTHDALLRRGCVFVVTTNDAEYLTSKTGNRRFWPVKVSQIDLDMARRLLPQVLAEATVAMMNGEEWWLSPDMEEIARGEQERRVTEDPWVDLVRDFLDRQFGNKTRKEGELNHVRNGDDGQPQTWFDISMTELLFCAVGVTRDRQDDVIARRMGVVAKLFGATRHASGRRNPLRFRKDHMVMTPGK